MLRSSPDVARDLASPGVEEGRSANRQLDAKSGQRHDFATNNRSDDNTFPVFLARVQGDPNFLSAAGQEGAGTRGAHLNGDELSAKVGPG
jgi:hypothetical protein